MLMNMSVHMYTRISAQGCGQAQCGRVEDTEMIRSKILQREGGWESLNDRMANFRKPQIEANLRTEVCMRAHNVDREECAVFI